MIAKPSPAAFSRSTSRWFLPGIARHVRNGNSNRQENAVSSRHDVPSILRLLRTPVLSQGVSGPYQGSFACRTSVPPYLDRALRIHRLFGERTLSEGDQADGAD